MWCMFRFWEKRTGDHGKWKWIHVTRAIHTWHSTNFTKLSNVKTKWIDKLCGTLKKLLNTSNCFSLLLFDSNPVQQTADAFRGDNHAKKNVHGNQTHLIQWNDNYHVIIRYIVIYINLNKWIAIKMICVEWIFRNSFFFFYFDLKFAGGVVDMRGFDPASEWWTWISFVIETE